MTSSRSTETIGQRICAIAAVMALTVGAARARDSAPAGEAQGLSESLRQLQEQVNELATSLQAVQAEAARSRAEVTELRRELREARAELATVGGSAAASGSPERDSTVATAGGAQPADARISERVVKLEEEQQLLSAKVDEQYQTKVESASKYRVRLSGIMLLNAFGNAGAVDNQDVPGMARPRGRFDSGGDFGATVRQTQLGLEVFGPRLGGARTSADVRFDFFGGFPEISDGVTMGYVRMRTATARVDWARTALVIGQELPFISPNSPTSFASVGFPAFSYAGNLWTWTPQIRIERRQDLSDTSSIKFQAGILDPLSGQPPFNGYYRLPQSGERSRQPAYATRFSWSRGPAEHALTLGAGAYYSRQDWGLGRHVDGWAATADWMVPFNRWLSFNGEFYRGRAVGGLGGGIGQSIIVDGDFFDPATSVDGLDSVGGWGQLTVAPGLKLEFNGALGQDNPLASDLRAAYIGDGPYADPIARNRSSLVNVIYRPRSNLLFSLEYRRLWTFYPETGRTTADHVNLGVGVLF